MMAAEIVSGFAPEVEREHARMRAAGIPADWVRAHGSATALCRRAWAEEKARRADPPEQRKAREHAAKLARERDEQMREHRGMVAAGRLADELRSFSADQLQAVDDDARAKLTALCSELASLLPVRCEDPTADARVLDIESETRAACKALELVHMERERRGLS